MALSNWLTLGEWSTAYLIGGLLDGVPDLSAQLRVGCCILQRWGYSEWAGISIPDVNDPMSLHKDENRTHGVRAITAEGDNSGCLGEVMDGTIDIAQRAKIALAWLAERSAIAVPEPMLRVLEELSQLGSEAK